MLRNIKTVFINKLSLKWFGDVSMLSYTHLFVYSKSGTFYTIDFIYILTRWSRVVTSLIRVHKWTYCLNVRISLCLYFCQLGKGCWFCWVFFFLTSTAEVFPPMQESAVRHMKSLLGSFSAAIAAVHGLTLIAVTFHIGSAELDFLCLFFSCIGK